MGPELAQGIVGVAKAVKAGHAIKGAVKNVSRSLKKWYKPSKPKKTRFKKAGASKTAPKNPAPAPTAPKM